MKWRRLARGWWLKWWRRRVVEEVVEKEVVVDELVVEEVVVKGEEVVVEGKGEDNRPSLALPPASRREYSEEA